MPRTVPPLVEAIGRQMLVGVGRVASRALVSAGQSVVKDVKRVGREMQRRAKAADVRLDEIIRNTRGGPGDDEEDDEDEDDDE